MDPLEPMPAPPPVQSVSSSAVTCLSCGYDLSGTAVGGTCPECGAAVEQSIRRVQNAGARTSGFAIASFVCGLLALIFSACFPLGFLGVVAIALYFPSMKEVNAGTVGGSSKGFAVAGLVMGIIATVLGFTCLAFFVIGQANNW